MWWKSASQSVTSSGDGVLQYSSVRLQVDRMAASDARWLCVNSCSACASFSGPNATCSRIARGAVWWLTPRARSCMTPDYRKIRLLFYFTRHSSGARGKTQAIVVAPAIQQAAAVGRIGEPIARVQHIVADEAHARGETGAEEVFRVGEEVGQCSDRGLRNGIAFPHDRAGARGVAHGQEALIRIDGEHRTALFGAGDIVLVHACGNGHCVGLHQRGDVIGIKVA